MMRTVNVQVRLRIHGAPLPLAALLSFLVAVLLFLPVFSLC